MLAGYVPSPNRKLNVVFAKVKNRVFSILGQVDSDLCNTGTTRNHINLAYYNYAIIYLAIIYSDVNKMYGFQHNVDDIKCKYNWTNVVNQFSCLGINLEELANSINLFVRETTPCTINCSNQLL